MNEPRDARSGALYRLDPDHRHHLVADDVMVANGLAFSPDDRLMYWSDSRALTIWVFDFDAASGEVANRRVVRPPRAPSGRAGRRRGRR